MRAALFDDAQTAAIRTALAGFTVDAVADLLGPQGRYALANEDHAEMDRVLDSAGPSKLADLVRLLLLGRDVPAGDAANALSPLPLAAASRAGVVELDGQQARARVEIRPYAEQDNARGADAEVDAEVDAKAGPWWVVSDFGADVRGGPLATDHVLGPGSASYTLAQLTPRAPVRRALDIGTGCGVQALHLARHAGAVVATDVNERALRFAATTAALSGQHWDLRAGSLLDPLGPDETFDLIVANPPFVVSDGTGGGSGRHSVADDGIGDRGSTSRGIVYRDSGRPGDALCAELIRGLPRALADNGSAHVLANWAIETPAGSAPSDPADWSERVSSWIAGTGCDAWVWQREVLSPPEYVSLWLRDAGLAPDRPAWAPRYRAWLDWFAAHRVAAIGMGFVSLWRTDVPGPVRVFEDVPQHIELPAGDTIAAWIGRQRWLASTDDPALLRARLRAGTDVVLDRTQQPGPDGWTDAALQLRQTTGLRWVIDADDAVAGLVAACSGRIPLGVLIGVLAEALERPAQEVADAVLPVVRDLLGRGFLTPPDGDAVRAGQHGVS